MPVRGWFHALFSRLPTSPDAELYDSAWYCTLTPLHSLISTPGTKTRFPPGPLGVDGPTFALNSQCRMKNRFVDIDGDARMHGCTEIGYC